jgi:hypothetical protein
MTRIYNPSDLSGYVPYTGASGAVNLNGQNLSNVGTLGAGAITGTSLGLGTGNITTSGDYISPTTTHTSTITPQSISLGATFSTTSGIASQSKIFIYKNVAAGYYHTLTADSLGHIGYITDGADTFWHDFYVNEVKKFVVDNLGIDVTGRIAGVGITNNGNLTFSGAARTVTTTNDGTNGYALTFQTAAGSNSPLGSGGNITFRGGASGVAGSGFVAGGSLFFYGGSGEGGQGNGGNLTFLSGAAAGGGIAGTFTLGTGTGNAGSGAVSIITGNTVGVSGATTIGTGNSSATASGALNLQTGTKAGTGTAGAIVFKPGTSEIASFLGDGTGLRFLNNKKAIFGTTNQGTIYHDATNLIINPKSVGSGYVSVLGSLQTSTTIYAGTNLQASNGDVLGLTMSIRDSVGAQLTFMDNQGDETPRLSADHIRAFTTSGTINIYDDITISDAQNIILNVTTGTKIGTATTQKLGFFNATPVVQPTSATDLGTALSNLGLRAAGTDYPLATTAVVKFDHIAEQTSTHGIILDNAMTGSVSITSPVLRLTSSTPTELAGDVNNWDVGNKSFIRASGGVADRIVTGILASGVADGHVMYISNIGTTNKISFANESASSTAANRILTTIAGTVEIGPCHCIQLIYDATSARWREMSHL